MHEMKVKQKTCKSCKEKFIPERIKQTCCSIICGIAYANRLRQERIKKAKAERNKIWKARKEKAKTRADWLKEAQAVFNKYIRLRDANLPCISCSRFHNGQYHAGHFKTVKAHGELRFNELNVHKQCAPCNNHLSGNLIEYEKGLIAKIGIDKVEWLKSYHEPKKWDIDEVKEIIKHYKLECKRYED